MSETTETALERTKAVADCVSAIRSIETREPVSRESLEEIAAELLQLATRADLFSEQRFPNPEAGEPARLYVLSEDTGGRFPLYLTCCAPGGTVPPHNHTTWAVVAGLSGLEENTIWAREDGTEQPGPAALQLQRRVVIGADEHLALLPGDIHSVATPGATPRRHFHMYGLSLQRLPERLVYDLDNGTCDFMAPNNKIVAA